MRFLERLREPSTWAGFAILGTIFGVKELAALNTPEIISSLGAIAAIFLPERK
jgi:hypothetical protein